MIYELFLVFSQNEKIEKYKNNRCTFSGKRTLLNLYLRQNRGGNPGGKPAANRATKLVCAWKKLEEMAEIGKEEDWLFQTRVVLYPLGA